jgi:magnesium chelatase subunit D
VAGFRGRLVGDRAPGAGEAQGGLALGATVRAVAARRQRDPGSPAVAPEDLREAVREQRTGNLVVLAVDASGSMGAPRRMEAAKGAAVSLLLDAYQRRDRVALVTFRGEGAEVVLRPTGSVEVARARLASLPTGGRTPLAAGIEAALDVARQGGSPDRPPLLVLLSDGRATAGPPGTDPVEAAVAQASAVRRQGVSAVVVDAEDGPTRLGLARRLAEVMGARYLTVPELSSGAVVGAVRDLVR